MTSDEGSERDPKQARLENPSGWIELTRYPTIRIMIDALLEAPPDHEFNKSQLSRRTGLSREAIRERIDLLVDLGVVETVEDGEWAEYKVNKQGKVTKELFELNSAVNSVLSGESKNIKRQPTIDIDNIDTDDSPDQVDLEGSIPDNDRADNSGRDPQKNSESDNMIHPRLMNAV